MFCIQNYSAEDYIIEKNIINVILRISQSDLSDKEEFNYFVREYRKVCKNIGSLNIDRKKYIFKLFYNYPLFVCKVIVLRGKIKSIRKWAERFIYGKK